MLYTQFHPRSQQIFYLMSIQCWGLQKKCINKTSFHIWWFNGLLFLFNLINQKVCFNTLIKARKYPRAVFVELFFIFIFLFFKAFQFDISKYSQTFVFCLKCGFMTCHMEYSCTYFFYSATLWMLFVSFFYCYESLHLKILSKELLQYLFLTKFIHPLSFLWWGYFLCCKAFCFTMLIRYCFYDTENMHTHTHIIYIQHHSKFVSQSIWIFIDKTIWHLEYIN